MKSLFLSIALATSTAITSLMPATTQASGELVMYCSAAEEWCRLMSETFERETGTKVLMTRRASGETFAQLKAEASQPRGDIWWGGSGDSQVQAAQEGLTEEYRYAKLDELQDWAKKQAETTSYQSIGIYAGALGFGYNTDLVKENPPACWKDLVEERFKDDVQVANPNSSGTSYTMLATLVQLMGEDEAFAYLGKLHKNVSQYTKSGSAPARAVATGETAIGITFMHDMVAQAIQGAPIKTVAPCEGTGYEVGSMSIIKGAPNLENAKKWYEWALTPAAQELAAKANSFQVPSNKNAKTPPEAPNFAEIKLISYDFAKYGSSEVRTHLLSRWDKEIGSQSK